MNSAFDLPLHADDMYIYVFSATNKMVFNILTEDIKLINSIINTINGNGNAKFDFVEYKNQRIYINNKPIFLIRGYGYLTSTGGLNLDSKTAAKIQDDFCNHIVSLIKN